MKQKIYILGVISAMIVFAGTIFKINHYPGAGILIIAGIASLLLLFLPLALDKSLQGRREQEKSPALHCDLYYLFCGLHGNAL